MVYARHRQTAGDGFGDLACGCTDEKDVFHSRDHRRHQRRIWGAFVETAMTRVEHHRMEIATMMNHMWSQLRLDCFREIDARDAILERS